MMYPDFLSPFVFTPSLPLRWYGLMYIFGVISGTLILKHSEKKGWIKFNYIVDKSGNKSGGVVDMIFYATLGTVLGARLGYFVFYSPSSILKPWEIIGINLTNGFSFSGFSGMSFHGGLIGLFITMYLFAKKYKYSFYDIGDTIALPASIALFWGRLGNFFNAELYGRATDSIFGMRFPMYDSVGGYERWISMIPALRPYTETRHPSQLYEMFLEGLVLAIISYALTVNSKKIKQGTRMWMWVLFYGLFRTLVEFVREVSEWQVGIITAGMFYSIPMVIVGASMLLYTYMKKESPNLTTINNKKAKK